MVRGVRMRLVSWYDHEEVMNQEETDEVADEMSLEVDSRDEMMRMEKSDL